MSYSEAITKNDLKKILGNIWIGTSLSTTVGSFTLNSGWTGDEIEVKQFGDVVMLKGYFIKSGGTGTNEIAIGSISGVSLPTSHVRFRIGAGNAAYNATNSGYGILAKSGQLSVKLSSSQTTVTVELTYIAAHSTGGYKYLIDMFYPVGSYYETSDANFNPNAAWGGTWSKLTKHNIITKNVTNVTLKTHASTIVASVTLPANSKWLLLGLTVSGQGTAGVTSNCQFTRASGTGDFYPFSINSVSASSGAYLIAQAYVDATTQSVINLTRYNYTSADITNAFGNIVAIPLDNYNDGKITWHRTA